MARQWQQTQWAQYHRQDQDQQGQDPQHNQDEQGQQTQAQNPERHGEQNQGSRWQHPPGHRADKAQDRRHELYRAKQDIKRLEDRLVEVKDQCQLEKRVMALEHQKKVSDMLAQAAAMALNHQAELGKKQEQIDALKAQHKTEEDGFKAEIRALKAKLEAEEQKTKMATAADLKPWMDANDRFVKQEKEMTAKIDELRNERVQLKKAGRHLTPSEQWSFKNVSRFRPTKPCRRSCRPPRRHGSRHSSKLNSEPFPSLDISARRTRSSSTFMRRRSRRRKGTCFQLVFLSCWPDRRLPP